MSGRHYLYRHVRLDTNQVFYIGIGSKQKNYLYGRANTSSGRTNRWHEVANASGKQFEVHILYESDNRQEIINKELEFIRLYKKETEGGTLVNHTSGGQGRLGYSLPKETIEKIAETRRGRKYPPEVRERMRIAQRNRMKTWRMTDEQRDKIRQAHLGRKHTEEAKIKMSLSRKGKSNSLKGTKLTEEQRAKYKGCQLGRILTPEHIEKLRVSHRGHKTPESTKQKMSASQKGKKRSPEAIEKYRLAARKRIANGTNGCASGFVKR